MASLHITQVKSTIGSQQRQRDTLRGLGIRRMHQTVIQPDRPEIRGMIAKVSHLVRVVEDDNVAPVPKEQPDTGRSGETSTSTGGSKAEPESAEASEENE